MPEAAGAVAAGAVADRLLGPRERRQLAIVLVGLPARGKTFTAAKLTRYLRWLGHDTKHFNVGKVSSKVQKEFSFFVPIDCMGMHALCPLRDSSNIHCGRCHVEHVSSVGCCSYPVKFLQR
jgi:hypothetical protein